MAVRFRATALSSGQAFVRRARLSAATTMSCRLPASRCIRAFAAQPQSGSEVSAEENKAKINSAWNASAQGYVDNVQDKGSAGGGASPPPKVYTDMSVGYKLAARIVASLSNKVQLKESGAPVVLDVASAGGEPAITIAKLLPDATVHATDFAPAMMDLIKRRAAEAGVSNVTAGVADGEALTGFGDGSVDAVTCTWGMLFMPNWKQAVKEFSRVLRGDGVVVVTLWERQEEDGVFERIHRVLDTLVPGFEGLIDPMALGEDKASAVAEEMKAAGLDNVTVSQFAVPLVLSPEASFGDIWEYYTTSSPLGQSISTLEAKGRTNVRQEARDIFESHMEEDCAEGRTPLGLPKKQGDEPRVIYSRALLVVGRKCGGG